MEYQIQFEASIADGRAIRLDGGRFELDTAADQIAQIVRDFMGSSRRKFSGGAS
jgi:hypothetical protein